MADVSSLAIMVGEIKGVDPVYWNRSAGSVGLGCTYGATAPAILKAILLMAQGASSACSGKVRSIRLAGLPSGSHTLRRIEQQSRIGMCGFLHGRLADDGRQREDTRASLSALNADDISKGIRK